jgi:hypothetical protein
MTFNKLFNSLKLDILLESYFSRLQLPLKKLLNQIPYEKIMSSQIDETYNLTTCTWELCHFNVVFGCVHSGIL